MAKSFQGVENNTISISPLLTFTSHALIFIISPSPIDPLPQKPWSHRKGIKNNLSFRFILVGEKSKIGLIDWYHKKSVVGSYSSSNQNKAWKKETVAHQGTMLQRSQQAEAETQERRGSNIRKNQQQQQQRRRIISHIEG